MLNEKVCIALPGRPTPGSAKKAFNYTQRWGKRWGRGVVCHNCFSPNPCKLTQAAITLDVAVSRRRKAPLRRGGGRAGADCHSRPERLRYRPFWGPAISNVACRVLGQCPRDWFASILPGALVSTVYTQGACWFGAHGDRVLNIGPIVSSRSL